MGFVLENILTVVAERVLRGGAEGYGIGLELRFGLELRVGSRVGERLAVVAGEKIQWGGAFSGVGGGFFSYCTYMLVSSRGGNRGRQYLGGGELWVCTCWVSRRAREGTGSWFGTEGEAGKAVQQGFGGGQRSGWGIV